MLSLFRTFLIAGVVLVGILWALRASTGDADTNAQGVYATDCPVVVRYNDKPLVVPPGAWTVSISDRHKTAPRIAVKRRGDRCLLTIKTVPGIPLEGVDWRIGFVLNGSQLRQAKRARLSVLLHADRQISFAAASFYAYDGKAVTAVPIPALDPQARSFVVEPVFSSGIPALEMWLRLTIHGAISATGEIIMDPFTIELFE